MVSAVRFTDDDIVRMGLTLIGSAAQFNSLDAPRGDLAKRLALSYNQIRTRELAKRRWVFAYEPEYTLPLVGTDLTRELPYLFEVPGNALRLIRRGGPSWRQYRDGVYSTSQTLKVGVIFDTTSDQFSPAFVEVMKWSIALEEVNITTQSNSKIEYCRTGYDAAVTEAGRQNAFVWGAETWAENEFDNSVTGAYIYGEDFSG